LRASARNTSPALVSDTTRLVRCEPHVELLLQFADLLAHGGLADVAPVGGPVEVQLLGERDEALQRHTIHSG